MAYHYTVPTSGYFSYDYSTSASTSPSPENRYDYYVPQYYTPVSSPNAGTPTSARYHVRTASYTAPRVSEWHSAGGYPSPGYYATMPNYTSPPTRFDHVSTEDSHNKQRARRFSMSGHGKLNGGKAYGDSNQKRQASARQQKQPIFVDAAAEAKAYDSSADEPMYTYIEPRLSRKTSTKKPTRKADNYFFFTQTTSSQADTPTRSRARRSSTNSKPKASPTPAKPAPVATAEDAARHNIPAGYSLKNWDPTEEPIKLLGSVFDANSLGKWIYDWTVYHHKAGNPITEIAGDLWLLMIKFAGKKKRAEECLPRILDRKNRDTMEQFQDDGDLVWEKLTSILKRCESFMWPVAKGGTRGKVQMGEKSGIEFVKSMFGRDRVLHKTESLMQEMRLWIMKFDAKGEDILRRPSS